MEEEQMNKSRLVDNKIFWNRIEEQNTFQKTLQEALRRSENESPLIVTISGDVGTGKTTLAKCFRDISGSVPFLGSFQSLWIDCRTDIYQDSKIFNGYISGEYIFDAIYRACRSYYKSSWFQRDPFKKYENLRKKNNEAENDIISTLLNDSDLIGKVGTPIGKILSPIIRAIVDLGPAEGPIIQILLSLGVLAAETIAPQIITKVQAAIKENRSRNDISHPYEELHSLIALGLRKIADPRHLLIFIDNYEIIYLADHWIRKLIKASGGKVTWVIIGRNNLLRENYFEGHKLGDYKTEFPGSVTQYEMKLLTFQELSLFFTELSDEGKIPEPDLINAIGEATCCNLMALDEAISIWAEEGRVDRIIRNVDNPLPHAKISKRMADAYLRDSPDKEFLLALGLARGDILVLRAMLGNLYSDDLLNNLRLTHIFVDEQEPRLNQGASLFLKEHFRNKSSRTEAWVKNLNYLAVKELQSHFLRLKRDWPVLEERYNKEEWVQIIRYMMDHYFWINEESGWKWCYKRYIEAIIYDHPICAELIKDIQAWESYFTEVGSENRLKILKASNKQVSIEFLNDLINHKDWLIDEDEDDDQESKERDAITTLLLAKEQILQDFDQTTELYHQLRNAEENLPKKGKKLSLFWDEVTNEFLTRYFGTIQDQITESRNLQDVETYSQSVISCLLLGNLNAKSGNYEAALDKYKQATELRESWVIYNTLGNFYDDLSGVQENILGYDTNLLESAETNFKKAIKIDPTQADPYNGLGLVYKKMGKLEDAVSEFNKSLDKKPSFTAALRNLAQSYLEFGQFSHALEKFSQITKENPNDNVALLGKGEAYRELEQFLDAEAAYKEVLTLNKSTLLAYAGLVEVYIQQGKNSEAEQISNDITPEYYDQSSKMEKARLARSLYILKKCIGKSNEDVKQALELSLQLYKEALPNQYHIHPHVQAIIEELNSLQG